MGNLRFIGNTNNNKQAYQGRIYSKFDAYNYKVTIDGMTVYANSSIPNSLEVGSSVVVMKIGSQYNIVGVDRSVTTKTREVTVNG